jgi:mannose-6-phosphate isomerase-like protein (cupin superfamily)
MKAQFVDNIEEIAIKNTNFRKVLSTTKHNQLVVMSLKQSEDIGMEIHKDVDQFFRIEKGRGKAILNGKEFKLKDGIALVIPAGTQHNIINTSKVNPLKLYTIYSPPQHKPGTINKNKPKEDHH